MRIDQYLVEQNLVATRSKAQDAIKQERVTVNGKIIIKNSYSVEQDDEITIKQEALSFVSRAGFKLYDVLDRFELHLQGRICMDVGASTGGFSDVCLKQGAAKVYALDVGRDQINPSLLKDQRLVNMEQINCRYLEQTLFEPLPDFACMDVSFISIRLLLPAMISVMSHVEIVALIKPQFEAGKTLVGKHGIIKDKKVHMQVLKEMVSFVEGLGLYVHHLTTSSILGRNGNKEFVMHIKQEAIQQTFDYKKIIEEEHFRK